MGDNWLKKKISIKFFVTLDMPPKCYRKFMEWELIKAQDFVTVKWFEDKQDRRWTILPSNSFKIWQKCEKNKKWWEMTDQPLMEQNRDLILMKYLNMKVSTQVIPMASQRWEKFAQTFQMSLGEAWFFGKTVTCDETRVF